MFSLTYKREIFMKKINALSKKLKELESQREEMEVKLSKFLIKQARDILKDDFSPSLVLALIHEGWNNSEKSKEEWLKAAESFQR